jgi:O-antigen ligase
LATRLGLAPPRFSGSLDWLQRGLYHLLSFETCFALVLYSNRFKPFLPPLPVDDTLVWMILCVPVGAYIVFRRGLYLPGVAILGATLPFLAWTVVSMAWSPARILVGQTLGYMIGINTLCVICGALVIAAERERMIRFLTIVFILSLAIAVAGLYIDAVYGSFRFFRTSGAVETKRLYLSWGYAVSSGAVIAYCVALYSRVMSRRQIVAIVLFAMTFQFLLVSSARGPLLSVVVVCLLPLLIGGVSVDRGRVLVRHSTLIAVLLVVAAAGYVVYLLTAGEGSATLQRFSKLLDQTDNPDLVEGANRFEYYAAAIKYWLQSPIIGNGIASFSLMFRGMEIPGTHPHNIILETLTNYGLVGFVLFLVMFGYGVRHATLRRLETDKLFMCVFLLFASRFVAAMYNTEIASQQPLMAFLGMLALKPPSADESEST